MEVTTLSTKGQVVIPERIRKGMIAGDSFVVTRRDDLIVLKKIEGLSEKEKEEMKELAKIWKEIDEGKCESYSEEEFFAKLREW